MHELAGQAFVFRFVMAYAFSHLLQICSPYRQACLRHAQAFAHHVLCVLLSMLLAVKGLALF